MPTDDNDAYGDLDQSYLKFIYEQFRRYLIYISLDNDSIFTSHMSICLPKKCSCVLFSEKFSETFPRTKKSMLPFFQQILIARC